MITENHGYQLIFFSLDLKGVFNTGDPILITWYWFNAYHYHIASTHVIKKWIIKSFKKRAENETNFQTF